MPPAAVALARVRKGFDVGAATARSSLQVSFSPPAPAPGAGDDAGGAAGDGGASTDATFGDRACGFAERTGSPCNDGEAATVAFGDDPACVGVDPAAYGGVGGGRTATAGPAAGPGGRCCWAVALTARWH